MSNDPSDSYSFAGAEKRAEKVIKKASSQHLQPFKDVMTAFFIRGRYNSHTDCIMA